MGDEHVVVIGGGIAGVTAALACADAGRNVTLLEARKVLGGRVSSVTHPRTGWELDNCQHACFRVYDRFMQLVGRTKGQDAIKLQARTVLPFASPATGEFANLASGRLSPPNHLIGSMLSFPFLSFKDKLAMRKAVKRLATMKHADIWALDGIPFRTWLEEQGQTDQAINRFWSFFVLAALNIDLDEASAAQACMLFNKGLFGDADAFDVGAFTSHLSESFHPAYLEALEQAGVQVRLNTSAKSIEHENGAPTCVKLAKDSIVCTDVIFTTPHHITARLLKASNLEEKSALIERDINSMDYRPLIGIHSFYRGNRVPEDFTFAVMIDEPLIQIIFNRNAELDQPVEEGVQWLSIPVSSAVPFMGMEDDEILAELDRVLDALWPEQTNVKRFEHLIIKTPKATFAPTPGSAEGRPSAGAISERIALGGCWTKTDWPSTMEGATRSGLQAAAHILKRTYSTDDAWPEWPSRPARREPGWRVWE